MSKVLYGILCCAFGAAACSASSGVATKDDASTTLPLGSGGDTGNGGATTTRLPVSSGGVPGSGGEPLDATGGNTPPSSSGTGGALTAGGATGDGSGGMATSSGGTNSTGGTMASGGRPGTGGSTDGPGGSSSTGGTMAPDAGQTGGTTAVPTGTGGSLAATGGATSNSGGISASGGTTGAGGSTGTAPMNAVCPNCKSIFDGASLSGWTQVPANSWSVVAGAMHSLGTARGFIYTNNTYGDFRFIFTSRLVSDPANHLPCVLFFGNSPAKDALSALQVQPPKGYMWDYRTTGATANKSPDMYETRYGGAPASITQWAQCEMLGNVAAGTMRFACCQQTGTTPCKAKEIVLFKDATAGKIAPLAFQVHNANMIQDFKDIFIESPVADPATLLTTK